MSDVSAFKPRIILNDQKGVNREDLPAHWDDEFIQSLARRCGWTRYYPWNGGPDPGETHIAAILNRWAWTFEGLRNALKIMTDPNVTVDHIERESAEYGITRALETMHDDLKDIIELINMTEGKWESGPSENLRPVDNVGSASA